MDFRFNTGDYDHGGDVSASTTGGDTLGKTVEVTIGADNTALTVVAIVDIEPQIAELETTTHNEETYREYIAGIKRAGMMKFTVHHEVGVLLQRRLHELKTSGEEEQFRVWFPGETTTWIAFTGIVMNVRYDAPVGDLVQGTFAVTPVDGIQRYGV